MFIVHTMEEIQGLMDAHAAFKATLGEADKEYNSIVGLVREVESIVKQFQIPGGLENPYTTLTAIVINLDAFSNYLQFFFCKIKCARFLSTGSY